MASLPSQTLSLSQQKALLALQSERNIFITGAPGTGKSFLINYFREQTKESVPVLASTGAAALLLGGRTFHSFFGLGLLQGGIRATVERALKNRRLKSRLRKTKTVIIDEVSMLSSDTLDAAEWISRAVTHSDRPWGGIRVIAVGDFAQLPPVSKEKEKPWAFLGEAWMRSDFQCVNLTEVMRTEDQAFLHVLEELRWGKISSRLREFLDACTQREVNDEVPHIFPRRSQTERFNQRKLEELPGDVYRYPTQYSGEEKYQEQVRRDAPIPTELELKEGALVMIRVNDPLQRFVNGSVGRVVELLDHSMKVELSDRTVQLEPFSFSLLDADGKEVAFAKNFPVNLAYASTIHKAQGATLDEAHLDLANLWEPGQAYVALSRLRNTAGLSLQRWTPDSIQADPRVQAFYKSQLQSV